MIQANVRQHLTRDDAQLALRLIARGSSDSFEEGETTLREQGIDGLLDDPRLYAGLKESRQGAHASFPLFAYVVVRHSLREVGEGDRILADGSFHGEIGFVGIENLEARVIAAFGIQSSPENTQTGA